MPVTETMQSSGGYRVIAIYQVDENGELVDGTLKYAVVDENNNIIFQFASFREAVEKMHQLVNESKESSDSIGFLNDQ